MDLSRIVRVLKVDKDTVQNFLQQERRIMQRLSIAANKEGKSNFISKAMLTLAASLGGAGALNKNRPLCKGKYNATEGVKGAAMYRNMKQCDTSIKAACNFSLEKSEQLEMDKCSKVMTDFRYD